MPTPTMRGVDPAGCPFCQTMASPDGMGVTLQAAEGWLALPADRQRPANLGHILLVPAIHIATLNELPDDHAGAMLAALKALTTAVRQAFAATGITVRLNLGPPGQSVGHLHLHVIPRHRDDGFPTTASIPIGLPERQRQADTLRGQFPAHPAS
jgi:histidine triad (HIT) family protein